VAFEGTDVTYTVVIDNSGDGDATGVTMNDPLPAGMTYVPMSISCTSGTCNEPAGNTIDWSGDLLIGQAATVTFDATVGTGLCGGAVLNTATIDHSSLLSPVTVSAGTQVWNNQIYFSDFEADDGGMVPNNNIGLGNNEWEWGVPTFPTGIYAYSGNNVWGTDLDFEADDTNENHVLELGVGLPPDPLGTGVWLNFWDYWGDEASDYRLISIDGVDQYQLPSGDQLYWVNWAADLGTWAGSAVTLGFNLQVCCAGAGPEGWYIDDVSIVSCLPATGLYLAPGTQSITGCAGNPQPVSVNLYNNTGTDGIFSMTYTVNTGNGTLTGPASLAVRQGESLPLDMELTGNICLPAGSVVTATVTADGNGYNESADMQLTTSAGTDLPWVPVAPTPQGNRYGAVIAHGTDIYQLGGETGWWTGTDVVNVYDTLTDTWTGSVATLPAALYGIDGVAIGDNLYVFGGNTGIDDPHNTPTNAVVHDTVNVYDTTTGTWSTADPLPTGVAYASVVTDGTLAYVVGGMDAAGAGTNLLQIFDPSQAPGSQWSAGTAMSQTRIYPGAGIDVTAGTIYVAGGYAGTPATTGLDTAEMYDIGTGTWSAMPTLAKTWAPYGDGMLGDKFVIFSGGDVSNPGTGTTYSCSGGTLGPPSVVWYDPDAGAWVPLTDLSRCYYGAEGVTVGNRLYLVSGRTNEGGWHMATEVEYYEGCPGCPGTQGTIQGNVLYAPVLTDMSGTAIEAYETAGSTMVGSTTTDAMGYYTLDLPDDNYDVYAERGNYLNGVYNQTVVSGTTVTLPDVTLLGGDMDDNGTVNIVDISNIALNFGGSGPAGDLNGDGTVNIVDISGAAANFGQIEPVPWP
jgi:uncharacterized repeat protein (TIGR01451 family)